MYFILVGINDCLTSKIGLKADIGFYIGGQLLYGLRFKVVRAMIASDGHGN